MDRRPLLLVFTAGIAVSLLLCAYGFHQATYQVFKEISISSNSLTLKNYCP
ncbi:hypothetical protein [Polaribacter irgensii]|uniref:hypothetical protein n=1 Tax=Polaribacter irgensii TaxID=531 RepID=UPI001EE197C6|nr:hypothetical protein [Polaribacter irgensii]